MPPPIAFTDASISSLDVAQQAERNRAESTWKFRLARRIGVSYHGVSNSGKETVWLKKRIGKNGKARESLKEKAE
jgi:hypothetical protein